MGLLKLLALCAFMFASSLSVGLLPLFVSLSPRHLRYVTTVGVGLLVGVAFIVIIPEGVHTYYGANGQTSGGHTHAHHAASAPRSALSHSSSQPSPLALLPSVDDAAFQHVHAGGEAVDHAPHSEEGDGHSHAHSALQRRRLLHADGEEADEGEEAEAEPCLPVSERSSSMVGLALVTGFVLMLLVDHVSGGHSHAHGPAVGPSASSSSGGSQRRSDARRRADDVKADVPSATPATQGALPASTPASPTPARLGALSPHGGLPPSSSSSSSSSVPPAPAHSNTALLGILTHSAIDGLALGAISVSENSALELVVFLAIVLHKGPAAFGLASFLLYQGRTRSDVRWLLTVFSAAAPLTSLLTFLFFWQGEVIRRARGGASGDGSAAAVSTELLGLCLLFSAGTFLFTIAAHILPEISKKEGAVTEWRYVLCLILGILLPLTLGGHHHH